MTDDSFSSVTTLPASDAKPLLSFNAFVGQECVLKKCCKKYKKGKRCKKCPD
ncbi:MULTISPECIES: hypothetical protein [Spirosoma]|jgi:hypothetical protein|uniref:hypothetical protein n=1 Tax=Spirosoma TaxID=107 RepID=UPI0013EAB307|nr:MULTISPECIES: hypothetical protein [Spirosoma]